MAALKPLAPERRHPADYRDEIERAEVAKILSELPDDHIALYAYYTGAREAADSIGPGRSIIECKFSLGGLARKHSPSRNDPCIQNILLGIPEAALSFSCFR